MDRLKKNQRDMYGAMARTSKLGKLADESIAFLAIASCEHANPNPGGRINAANLIIEIQKALGREPRDVFTPEERKRLEAEAHNS